MVEVSVDPSFELWIGGLDPIAEGVVNVLDVVHDPNREVAGIVLSSHILLSNLEYLEFILSLKIKRTHQEISTKDKVLQASKCMSNRSARRGKMRSKVSMHATLCRVCPPKAAIDGETRSPADSHK